MKSLKLIAAVCLSLLIGAGVAEAITNFNLYSSLTGNEIVTDQVNPTGGAFKTSVLGNYVSQTYWHNTLTTVAALPTCNSAAKGQTFYVTDASSPTYGGTLTGSSTTFAVAICNGTNWTGH